MPSSEYIRRRRTTVAAADVLGDRDLLGTAVAFGYGSTEAFNRAFRAVHGVSPWFPSNPWRLRPGPSVVAILDRSADFSTATSELWLPVERA